MLPRSVAVAVFGFLVLAPILGGQAVAAEVAVTVNERPDYKAVFGQVESRECARPGPHWRHHRLSVDEGSAVKAGDVVAMVVDDKLALQLEALDARIHALGSELGMPRRTGPRKKLCQGGGSQEQGRYPANPGRCTDQPARRREGGTCRAGAAGHRRQGDRAGTRPGSVCSRHQGLGHHAG